MNTPLRGKKKTVSTITMIVAMHEIEKMSNNEKDECGIRNTK